MTIIREKPRYLRSTGKKENAISKLSLRLFVTNNWRPRIPAIFENKIRERQEDNCAERRFVTERTRTFVSDRLWLKNSWETDNGMIISRKLVQFSPYGLYRLYRLLAEYLIQWTSFQGWAHVDCTNTDTEDKYVCGLSHSSSKFCIFLRTSKDYFIFLYVLYSIFWFLWCMLNPVSIFVKWIF